MTSSEPVTNEDLMAIMQDMMQMTSEGFERLEGRFDGVEGRLRNVEGQLDGVEGRLGNVEGELKELRNASYRHEAELGKQMRLVESTHEEMSNLHIDLNEILHRIAELERKTVLSKKEQIEAQAKLQQVIDWAKVAAKQIGVPLKLT